MTFWLILLAALFSYLAFDAWRLGSSSTDAPYEIEANVRGEPLGDVPLSEQHRRKSWSRRYGLGEPSHIFWVWSLLAFGCLAAAVLLAAT